MNKPKMDIKRIFIELMHLRNQDPHQEMECNHH